MSYLSEPRTSGRNYTLLVVAAIIHVILGYALITGLAQHLVKKIIEPIKTVDVKEEKPPEEKPPPPPEKLQDIPVVTPPPEIQVQQQQAAPVITTTTTVARPYVQAPVIAPPAPTPAPTPAPPPKPAVAAQAARQRGDNHKRITDEDYPDASLRAEEEGTTRVRYDINERGSVENCTVTQSSGHPRLDQTACTLITRRFRFEPARAEGGAAMREDGHSDAIKWVVPKG